MFKVLVMSRTEAVKSSYHLPCKTAILSITDVDSPFCKFASYSASNFKLKGVLSVKFDDVSDREVNHMDENDAKKIIQFILSIENKVDLLVVHCEAGVSRSAGVAAAILKYLTNDDSQIFNCAWYKPNMYCYYTLLNEFHKN